MQGVVKSYDPGTGDGVVIRDTDFAEFDLADGALEGAADMCNKVVTDFPTYSGIGAVLFFAAAVLKALSRDRIPLETTDTGHYVLPLLEFPSISTTSMQ